MKRYRVEYNQYGIQAITEDGAFTTASPNSVIADTIENIKTMLTALGIDCTKLNEYS